MITETGRVVAVEADCLWVETIRQSTCNSCAVQKGCGHSLLNKVKSGRAHHLKIPLTDLPASNFSVDDEVEISIPEQALAVGALVVYMLPLLAMLLGALMVSQWWAGDAAAMIGAVVGFSVGILLVKIHSLKTQSRIHVKPAIISSDSDISPVSIPFLSPS